MCSWRAHPPKHHSLGNSPFCSLLASPVEILGLPFGAGSKPVVYPPRLCPGGALESVFGVKAGLDLAIELLLEDSSESYFGGLDSHSWGHGLCIRGSRSIGNDFHRCWRVQFRTCPSLPLTICLWLPTWLFFVVFFGEVVLHGF